MVAQVLNALDVAVQPPMELVRCLGGALLQALYPCDCRLNAVLHLPLFLGQDVVARRQVLLSAVHLFKASVDVLSESSETAC